MELRRRARPSGRVCSPDGMNATHPNHENAASRRATAVLYILARNSNIDGTVRSVRRLEDRFNGKFGHPWVVLSEEPLSEKFKTTLLTSGSHMQSICYVVLSRFSPRRDRSMQQPATHRNALATSYRAKSRLARSPMITGSSPPGERARAARKRWCRKTFSAVAALRIDTCVGTTVRFSISTRSRSSTYGTEEHNKTYAFTMALYEHRAAIPNLWSTVKTFTQVNPEYIAEDNSMGFTSKDDGESFQPLSLAEQLLNCGHQPLARRGVHEVLEHRDSQGGFYYERWCDLTCAQYCGLAVPEQIQDPFLRRDRVRPPAIHPLSERQRCMGTREMFMRHREVLASRKRGDGRRSNSD
ncbi:hypothetical protein C8Q80DRAFT_1207928, partial [Daedaleopsis nitida]